VSIGHYAITAGTLGAVVVDNVTNDFVILSNNHVLANSNNANIGDKIFQPGPIDGGSSSDTIATLGRFVKIKFPGDNNDGCGVGSAVAAVLNGVARLFGRKTRLKAVKEETTSNLMDAAIAVPVSQSDVKQEQYNLGTIVGITDPVVGNEVTKSGRTTGVTTGTIQYLDATISVGYGNNKTATFDHQIVTSDMSQGGDSGSVVCKWIDGELYAIGLLFAGSDTHTIMNDIDAVIAELNFRFV